jgi:hypothetical protein
MPPRICYHCTAENDASAYACSRCGVTFVNAPDATGRKPFNVAGVDLTHAIFFTPLLTWLAYEALREGRVSLPLFLSNEHSFIVLTGHVSVLLGALSAVAAAAALGSMAIDFFDTRNNELLYRKVLRHLLSASVLLIALAVLVAYTQNNYHLVPR